jgi:hypothetical protein
MDTHTVIRSQYHATLDMLEEAIRVCPKALWTDSSHTNAFWRVAYHTVFFTHLYLSESLAGFVPWSKGRPKVESLGVKSDVGEPYSVGELLEYLAFCRRQVDDKVPALDLETASGFEWLPMNKLELQFYNIRHTQHHTGQLSERLRTAADVGLRWVADHE